MGGSNNRISPETLKAFLDEKAGYYNSREFIDSDPIQVPHQFIDPADIEISAFLTATLSWGRRTTIITSARRLVSWMPGGPYAFISGAKEGDFARFLPFVHRTFNGIDCVYFLEALGRIYRESGGLRGVFEGGFETYGDLPRAIIHFRKLFLRNGNPGRTSRHVPDLERGSAAKRINMFLRWMVRRDSAGVDFGIWDRIPMAALYVPLDLHSGTTARKLGLLQRKQNDWAAVEELTSRLRELDPADPVRYDFALFGLGAIEKF